MKKKIQISPTGPRSGVSSGRQPDVPGQDIRGLRKARGWTLENFSRRTGLSVGYLSLIERNQSTPSIKALHSIATELGVTIGWFFEGENGVAPEDRGYVVRQKTRKKLGFNSGVTDNLLSPSLNGKLEFLWCEFEPYASSGDATYEHDGEEAGVVISGQFELWVGDNHFLLEAGDSFGFSSSEPHRYRNPGNQAAVIVWAITPPSY